MLIISFSTEKKQGTFVTFEKLPQQMLEKTQPMGETASPTGKKCVDAL